MNLLIRYLKALKWICEADNINIIIISENERADENLKNEKIRDNWNKLNAEISKEALSNIIFNNYLDVMLSKYDVERREKIGKVINKD